MFEVFHVLQDFGIEECVGVDAPEVVEVIPGVERHQVVGHEVRQHGRQPQNVLKFFNKNNCYYFEKKIL